MSKLRKLANLENEYDSEYRNNKGQVTPYHILFKDYESDITSLSVEGAIQYCISTIEDLNEQYGNDEGYYFVSDEEKEELKRAFQNNEVDSGIDVLFTIKDFLLKSEGLEIQSNNNIKRLKKRF